MTLEQRIRREIASAGPIPFEVFMDLALYDPEGGFFTTGKLRSERGGDFLTSPEVSALFGETLAGFVERERGADRPAIRSRRSGGGIGLADRASEKVHRCRGVGGRGLARRS